MGVEGWTFLVATRGLDSLGLAPMSLQTFHVGKSLFLTMLAGLQPTFQMWMTACMTTEAEAAKVRRMVCASARFLSDMIDLITITATLPALVSITLENKLPE